MDPVTQGAFGAVFAQASGYRKDLAKAALIGALAGMAPDLDVLIRSENDPLLALEYHRHFTHSLMFIPIGAVICALVLHAVLGKRWGFSFKRTLLWCFIGYATHAVLDACTSYGTQLLWPFTNYRYAWDIISVVDPLVTLPILAMVVLASWRHSKALVYVALVWLGLYFSFAWMQHTLAISAGYEYAESRGHFTPTSLQAKPSFANAMVWKIIYETEDRYYVDAVRVGPLGSDYWEGTSIAKLDLERDLPWLDKTSQQAKDIERFRWFSMGYIALDPNHPNRIGDIRYSTLPHQIKPLWGIQLDPEAAPDAHVEYVTDRGDARAAFRQLWQMITD